MMKVDGAEYLRNAGQPAHWRIGLLMRRVCAAAPSSELSLTESAALSRLDREGPSTIADLTRAESVKPQSMGTIATMEAMGLIERKPHPTDGRQMNIQLTANGIAVRKGARNARRTWLAQAISQLDKQEQEKLFAVTGTIKRLMESDQG
jgi:DNA-binding MarR family transcriptional regulator